MLRKLLEQEYGFSIHPDTQIAIKVRYVNSLLGCIEIGMADVAKAILENGQEVYVTWGRNLDAAQQADKRSCGVKLVSVSGSDKAECIIPDDVAEKLLALSPSPAKTKNGEWNKPTLILEKWPEYQALL